MISSFRKFWVKDNGKGRGSNTDTGEDLIVAERRLVTFRSSTVVKKLNGDEG
jgi:nucleoid DNA-binding protein